jgi:hypothetical protein
MRLVALSSTTSARRSPIAGGSRARRRASLSRWTSTGTSKKNVVPFPGSLSNPLVPPITETMREQGW